MKRARLGMFVGVTIGLSACVTLLSPSRPDPLVRCPLPDRDYPWLSVLSPPSEGDWNAVLDDLRSLGISEYRNYAWLRDPEHLLAAYATCKSVGLERLLSQEEYWSPVYSMSNHPAYHGLTYDSILTRYIQAYRNPKKAHAYYVQFWERRKAEGNAEAVHSVFLDIRASYRGLPHDAEELPAIGPMQALLEADLTFRDDSTSERHCAYAQQLDELDMHASARSILIKQAWADEWSNCLAVLYDSLPYWNGTEQQYDSTALSDTRWLVPETYFHGP